MSYAVVFSALALLAVLGGAIAMMVWWVRRPLSSRAEGAGVPLPLFSHDRAALWGRDEEDVGEEMAAIIATRAERSAAASVPPSWASTPSRASRTATDYHARSSGGTATRRNGADHAATSVRTAASAGFAASSYAPPAPTASGQVLEGTSVRYSVPTDSTLQFLAGRLEITSGSDLGREIRFVRLPGGAPVEITFGRTDGPPYRHVQLQDATVSRQHAQMRLQDGRWRLRNLSATNPVVHNGRALGSDEECALEEGDRIEMGEVVFRFRA
jgi:hypothetical protein